MAQQTRDDHPETVGQSAAPAKSQDKPKPPKTASAPLSGGHLLAQPVSEPPREADKEPIPEGVIPYVSPRETLQKKFDHYVETRWSPQWHYYDEGAAHHKARYLRYQVFIALGSVAVPILIGINFVQDWIPAVISGLVAAAAAIENVQKYGDHWRAFRSAAEGMKREKVLFETGAGPYSRAKAPFRLFVERSEAIIAEETGRYIERAQESEGEDGGADSGQ